MRILIAEDDYTSRAMLTAALHRWGYDPIVTENGLQAWSAIQKPDAPKLILLDWNMPEMDGLEVTRRIRALDTAEPSYIIILTSKSEKANIVAGLDIGANDYIIKPYDAEELLARIRVGQRMLELQAGLLAAQKALAHQAKHDFLTGVLNRGAILNILTREISRITRENSALVIGILDIDHFKIVNDTYGHFVGDEVLCGFVRLLEKSLRDYDYLGRWGGEEFLVISLGCKENEAERLYERLRTVIAGHPIPTKAGNLSLTVSIGVAAWNGSETGDELIAAADAGMYQAKKLGRNQVFLIQERPQDKK